MHYENTAFGKAGFCKTTIIVKNDPSYEVRPVYVRGVFSPQDVKKINKLYGCPMKELPAVGKCTHPSSNFILSDSVYHSHHHHHHHLVIMYIILGARAQVTGILLTYNFSLKVL
jgi:hypothetical protein